MRGTGQHHSASTGGGRWRPRYASAWSWGVRPSSSFLRPLTSVIHPFSGSWASPDRPVTRPPLAGDRAIDFPIEPRTGVTRHGSHSAADAQGGRQYPDVTFLLHVGSEWNRRERKPRHSTCLECLTLSVVTPVHWWDSWPERGERTPMPSGHRTGRGIEKKKFKPAEQQRKC